MTWTRITGVAFTILLTVVGWAFAAGDKWNTQSALPSRMDQVEAEQRRQGESLSRVEGKVDTVINLLRRSK